MMLLDVPEQLRCLWRHLRQVSRTEFHPRYTNEKVNVLVHAVDGYMHEATIKLKIANKKTYNNSLIQQPNCLELVLYGE